VHTSLPVPQLPDVVLHPAPAEHPTVQHTLPVPVTHSVVTGLHVHVPQDPAPSQVRVHVAG
jgi:hypothetical protein